MTAPSGRGIDEKHMPDSPEHAIATAPPTLVADPDASADQPSMESTDTCAEPEPEPQNPSLLLHQIWFAVAANPGDENDEVEAQP